MPSIYDEYDDFLKVLLVEDDPITRWLVRLALKGECILATARDADQAVNAYPVYRPDLVFLDIELPDFNGKEVLTSILEKNPEAHIVMFSSHASSENVIETFRRGARGFVAKPFTRDDLLKHVLSCPAVRQV